jgi:serine/threonine-protein kinase 24/25/MST4
MATGSPPYADLHPMRVLFLIPKNDPPQLEGQHFSKILKEFVALCLVKNVKERPSAKDLLKHKLVKNARRTSILVELIERQQVWQDAQQPMEVSDDP